MRVLDTDFAAALEAGVLVPAILADLTFRSATEYVWSGYGPLTWNAQTYQGVGRLGAMGSVTEGISVSADGTSVTLSGIDPTLYAESMTDVQIGAPAILRVALFSGGAMVGTPTIIYSGTVDKPTVSTGPDKIAITLNLESRMSNLKRASNRRYTQADQNVQYPTDSGFVAVESLNNCAINWGG
jgi:hypothetical protein